MTQEEFRQLAQNIHDGSATEEQLLRYNQYYNSLQKEEHVLTHDLQEKGQMIYSRLQNQIQEGRHNRVRSKRRYRPLAAAASIILVSAASFWFLLNSGKLQQSQPISLTKTSGASNALITLPDGSSVILEKGSKLSYPASFDKSSREVSLSGRGFFNIRKKASMPFIVHSGTVHTTVLGTSFDIEAYPGTAKVTVRVASGKVSVAGGKTIIGILTPNQQLVYNQQSKKTLLATADARETSAWKEKDLVFNDVSFAEAGKLLEERFGVQIAISNPQLAQKHFTTTLYENQNLGDFLSLICDFNQARFKIEGKTVLIDPVN